MNGKIDFAKLQRVLGKYKFVALILCLGVVLMLLPVKGGGQSSQIQAATQPEENGQTFDLEELERRLEDCDKPITVAVMGCVVNGPGEASAADIGVAGGKGKGILFKKGQVLGTYPYERLCDALTELIENDKEQQ